MRLLQPDLTIRRLTLLYLAISLHLGKRWQILSLSPMPKVRPAVRTVQVESVHEFVRQLL